MRRRTLPSLLVQSSFVGAVALTTGSGLFEAKSMAQVPAVKQKEIKLKADKEITEKSREKDKARSGKSEKMDLAPLDEYYRDFLIPLLTQSSPELVNRARKEILEDIEVIEKNKELNPKFIASFIPQMKELASRDKDGKVFAPQTRINAAILMGRLNKEVATNGASTPEPRVQASLLEFLEQKDNDGVTSSGLSTLTRHVKSGTVNEVVLNKFVPVLASQLTSPAPVNRDPDAHNYLTEQVILCLTEIAKLDPDKGPGKLAATALAPALLKIIDEQKSEWLVETALFSFGTIKTVSLTPEEVITVEKAIAKFVKQSLKDWKKRIANSSGLTGLMGGGTGYPGGGMDGMSSSGGPGKGGMGGMDGGDGYGPAMGGTKPNQKKNPTEEQPKEVKNARRIAHQRFERIHLALNGAPRKPTAAQAASPKVDKALVALISAEEKDKVLGLLAKVELFQEELNDHNIKDLTSLTIAVTTSVKDLRVACDLILGEKKTVVADAEDEAF